MNATNALTFKDKVLMLETQLLNVWEAMSLREKKNKFLRHKFAMLREHIIALKQMAGIETKGFNNQ